MIDLLYIMLSDPNNQVDIAKYVFLWVIMNKAILTVHWIIVIFYTNILNSRLTFIATVKTGIIVRQILESTSNNRYVEKFKTAYNDPENNIRKKMDHIKSDTVYSDPETYDFMHKSIWF